MPSRCAASRAPQATRYGSPASIRSGARPARTRAIARPAQRQAIAAAAGNGDRRQRRRVGVAAGDARNRDRMAPARLAGQPVVLGLQVAAHAAAGRTPEHRRVDEVERFAHRRHCADPRKRFERLGVRSAGGCAIHGTADFERRLEARLVGGRRRGRDATSIGSRSSAFCKRLNAVDAWPTTWSML